PLWETREGVGTVDGPSVRLSVDAVADDQAAPPGGAVVVPPLRALAPQVDCTTGRKTPAQCPEPALPRVLRDAGDCLSRAEVVTRAEIHVANRPHREFVDDGLGGSPARESSPHALQRFPHPPRV